MKTKTIAKIQAELVKCEETPVGELLAVQTNGWCTTKESILLVNALIHAEALKAGSEPGRYADAVRGIQETFDEGADGITFIRLSEELAKQLEPQEEQTAGRMKVRINTHGGHMPETHGEWTDLFTAGEYAMKEGEYRTLSLGVSIEIPTGYYAEVLPRSSTCKKWGIMLANSMGIIEQSYCGDGGVWRFPAYAIRDTVVPDGVRIAQFRLVRQAEPMELVRVERLGNPDRGGLGSTGSV